MARPGGPAAYHRANAPITQLTMARLPRLELVGHLHLVIQRARDTRPVFVDDDDRRRYLAALLESSRESEAAVHAYVLMDDGVLLLRSGC